MPDTRERNYNDKAGHQPQYILQENKGFINLDLPNQHSCCNPKRFKAEIKVTVHGLTMLPNRATKYKDLFPRFLISKLWKKICVLLITVLLSFFVFRQVLVVIPHKVVRLVKPEGLVKELFPNQELVPYEVIPIERGFRYPLNIDMVDLANSRMSGQTVDFPVINPHTFKFLHNLELLCSQGNNESGIRLLILVKSAVIRYNLRGVIRKTWMKALKGRKDIRVAFLLGYSRHLQYVVDNEQFINQDIIQEDFVDSYLNNTHKMIMAFNWITKYCSNAKLILFLDDDMFLNIDQLLEFVSESDVENSQNMYSGILAHRGSPVRDTSSKWHVPWSEYPYDVYPDYLAGSVIFTSPDVVRKFQAVFPYIRYSGIDDVYLGITAHKLNIKPSNMTRLDNDHLRNFKELPNIIANHGFDNYELFYETYMKMMKDKE